MRILLIYPNITFYGSDSSCASAVPPLGMAYLASYIEQYGHHVKILDCIIEGYENIKKSQNSYTVGLDEGEIERRIRNFSPDIVGISAMFTSYAEDAYHIAAITKKINTNILVVFGGAHTSVLYNKVLENESCDVCIIGEGELTFTELIEKFQEGKDYKTIKGIAFRDGDRIVLTEERELIKNLDTVPFMATHLLPMELYFKYQNNPYTYYKKHFYIVTSRGCPKRCIYCTTQIMWKNKWRARTAVHVVSEILQLTEKHGIKEIHFVDDNITIDKNRATELFNLLIEKKMGIKWTCPSGVAIWTLDEDMIRLMKKSGCYRLTFGIESGSQETQKYIKKNLNLEKAEKLIQFCNRIGLWTVSTFIFGFPDQDRKQIEESINFAINSNSDFATFYTLMPFPGTEIYEILKKQNLLDDNDYLANIGYYLSTRGVTTHFFSHEEIHQLTSHASQLLINNQLKRLVTQPSHYWRKIRSVSDFIYVLKLARNFVMIIRRAFQGSDIAGGLIYWGRK